MLRTINNRYEPIRPPHLPYSNQIRKLMLKRCVFAPDPTLTALPCLLQDIPVKPLPSLLAHSALRSLLHPVTTLLEGPGLPSAAGRARPAGWSAGAAPVPCDLELTALRSSLAGGDGGDRFWPGAEVVLTVRRVGADCRFPGPAGDSCAAAGKVSTAGQTVRL